MKDVHHTLTASIVAMLEAGTPPWRKSWKEQGGLPVNGVKGNRYHGINVLNLWMAAMTKGYADNRWASYNQWKQAGAQVREGEKGTPVFFYRVDEKATDAGDLETRVIHTWRHVFNAEQCDGAERLIEDDTRFDTIEDAQALIAAVPHRWAPGNPAYVPMTDTVMMPRPESFASPQLYYSTYFHELAHWTGAKSRLDRDMSVKFGSESYGMEELVAELAASFLCARTGIALETKADSAAYLASWLKILKADSRAIFTAASAASKAAEFLEGYMETEERRAA